jgi:uracil phosphoribosyltransferase
MRRWGRGGLIGPHLTSASVVIVYICFFFGKRFKVDAGMNEHKYIVPGLGDYGDRFFNTV